MPAMQSSMLGPTFCQLVRPSRLIAKTNSAELSEVRFGSGNCTTARTRPSSSGHTRDSVSRRPAILRGKFQPPRNSLEMRAVGRHRYTIHSLLAGIQPTLTSTSATRFRETRSHQISSAPACKLTRTSFSLRLGLHLMQTEIMCLTQLPKLRRLTNGLPGLTNKLVRTTQHGFAIATTPV